MAPDVSAAAQAQALPFELPVGSNMGLSRQIIEAVSVHACHSLVY